VGFIEKRNGHYRARYRDPLGRQKCKSFSRKADAQRFLVVQRGANQNSAKIVVVENWTSALHAATR